MKTGTIDQRLNVEDRKPSTLLRTVDNRNAEDVLEMAIETAQLHIAFLQEEVTQLNRMIKRLEKKNSRLEKPKAKTKKRK